MYVIRVSVEYFFRETLMIRRSLFYRKRGAEYHFDYYVGYGSYFLQVGMKEKVAAVLFSTSTQALIFCAFHDNCVGPDYKVI